LGILNEIFKLNLSTSGRSSLIIPNPNPFFRETLFSARVLNADAADLTDSLFASDAATNGEMADAPAKTAADLIKSLLFMIRFVYML
jgi:hypothetical protein